MQKWMTVDFFSSLSMLDVHGARGATRKAPHTLAPNAQSNPAPSTFAELGKKWKLYASLASLPLQQKPAVQ
jgi:hypothetical protein